MLITAKAQRRFFKGGMGYSYGVFNGPEEIGRGYLQHFADARALLDRLREIYGVEKAEVYGEYTCKKYEYSGGRWLETPSAE
jgi:hypothetical protein